jgi:serine/threonine protein kinase
MGVVYRAIDEKLRRSVAIKLLSARYMADERNKELIFREARSAAALTHPNIAAIHEVHDGGDAAFYVMELVDGDTLRQRIARSRIPVVDALRWARQIASALARAHEAGVIHRDLKADNIMITKSGDVKLLDFGLAKVIDIADLEVHNSPVSAVALAPTLVATAKGTEHGRVMGTPAYMAPEQARGEPVDARVDVFAFGVVLYEMLTGQTPFAQRTGVPTGDADSSDWKLVAPLRELAPKAPRAIERLVQRCLAFDRAERFADGAALAVGIEASAKRRRAGWAIAIGAIVAASIVAAIAPRSRTTAIPESSLSRLVQSRAQQLTFEGVARLPDLSRDGRFLVYASGYLTDPTDVIVRDVSSGSESVIYRGAQIVSLRWSPTGDAVLVGRGEGGAIVVPKQRGPWITTGLDPLYVSWSPDGNEIVGARNTTEWRVVDRYNRVARSFALTIPRSVSIQGIDWGMNGLIVVLSREQRGHSLWTIKPDGSELREAYRSESILDCAQPRWNPTGTRIYYARQGAQLAELVALQYDPATGLAREEASVPNGVDVRTGFAVATDERSVIVPHVAQTDDLVIASGAVERRLISTTETITAIAVTPDHQTIAFSGGAPPRTRIQLVSASSGAPSQVATVDGTVRSLAWSPDGHDLAYTLERDGETQLYRLNISTRHTSQLPTSGVGRAADIEWLPGGQILYPAVDRRQYHVLDPASLAEHNLVPDDGFVWWPRVSPDQRSVAVDWSRSTFAMGIWIIALDSGSQALLLTRDATPIGWSDDGQWLYAGHATPATPLEHRIYALSPDRSRSSRLVLESRQNIVEARPLGTDQFVLHAKAWSSDLWRLTDGTHDPMPIALPTNRDPLTGDVIEVQDQVRNLRIDAPPPRGADLGWTSAPGSNVDVHIVNNCRAHPYCLQFESAHAGAVRQRVSAVRYSGRRIRFHVQGRGNVEWGVRMLCGSRERKDQLQMCGYRGARGDATIDVLADVLPDEDVIELRFGVGDPGGQLIVDDGSVELVQ